MRYAQLRTFTFDDSDNENHDRISITPLQFPDTIFHAILNQPLITSRSGSACLIIQYYLHAQLINLVEQRM